MRRHFEGGGISRKYGTRILFKSLVFLILLSIADKGLRVECAVCIVEFIPKEVKKIFHQCYQGTLEKMLEKY